MNRQDDDRKHPHRQTREDIVTLPQNLSNEIKDTIRDLPLQNLLGGLDHDVAGFRESRGQFFLISKLFLQSFCRTSRRESYVKIMELMIEFLYLL